MAMHFKAGDYIAFGTHSGTVYLVEAIWGREDAVKGIPRIVKSVGTLEKGKFAPHNPGSILYGERHLSNTPEQWATMDWKCINKLINIEYMNHPNFHVINKVKAMNEKRKAKGYAF